MVSSSFSFSETRTEFCNVLSPFFLAIYFRVEAFLKFTLTVSFLLYCETMDQATGMTYNVVSPSSAGTTPTTIAPSSTHTSPTVIATPSPVAPTMIEVIQTVQTSGAFACIVQECSNKVPTEHTICEACHGRATMMFQEMRKFVSFLTI